MTSPSSQSSYSVSYSQFHYPTSPDLMITALLFYFIIIHPPGGDVTFDIVTELALSSSLSLKELIPFRIRGCDRHSIPSTDYIIRSTNHDNLSFFSVCCAPNVQGIHLHFIFSLYWCNTFYHCCGATLKCFHFYQNKALHGINSSACPALDVMFYQKKTASMRKIHPLSAVALIVWWYRSTNLFPSGLYVALKKSLVLHLLTISLSFSEWKTALLSNQ